MKSSLMLSLSEHTGADEFADSPADFSSEISGHDTDKNDEKGFFSRVNALVMGKRNGQRHSRQSPKAIPVAIANHNTGHDSSTP